MVASFENSINISSYVNRKRLGFLLCVLFWLTLPHAAEVQEIEVFRSGEDQYHTFRIPAILRAANGDLLAFAEGRVHHAGDSGDIDLVMKRSTDGGRTWGKLQRIGDYGKGCIGNPAPVLDRVTGHISLLAVLQPEGSHESDIRNDRGGYRDPCLLRSTDHGQTWTKPVSLADTCDRKAWRWYATGPGHGIQLEHGQHAGRLVVPANHSVEGSGENTHLAAHAILSDDGGRTWRIGAVDDSHVGSNTINPNESAVAECADGRLLFNARDQGGSSKATRLTTYSSDGGESFDRPYQAEDQLVAPVCQGSLLAVTIGTDRYMVFSGPGKWDSRSKLRLRISPDKGKSWRDGPVLYQGPSAYSDLVTVDAKRIGCLFEVDHYRRIVFTLIDTQALLENP